jgi:D-alanine-D-alanine ligase
MKVCVLQPDYTGSAVEYGNYDPRRDLSPWLPGHRVDHLFLRKANAFAQLQTSSREKYDIYINLCEGYPEWDTPGFDVIWSLERLNLPYTGPSPRVFLPSKTTMKIVAHTMGVPTPAWSAITALDRLPETLRYPLFVKPADSGDSLGIDEHSLVNDNTELHAKCADLFRDYRNVLIEEYVDGREFTVLVAADTDTPGKVLTLTPFEFVFDCSRRFKTYRMKVMEHHGHSNVPVFDSSLSQKLRDMAARIFLGFEGESFARIDFRSNQAGELFFLEINCECSIFYPDGSEGSADYILKHDPLGREGFLEIIMAEGIARHRRRQKRFDMRPATNGELGCFARLDFAPGETVWMGEARLHRLATCSSDPRTIPSLPAFTGSLVMLRDADPRNWAPFRFSDQPNAAWRGLNLVAQRSIAAGEELTVRR